MGEVVAFGLPLLRARRKPVTGFCEVTVLPARAKDDCDAGTPPRSPKTQTRRKPNGPPRPAGLGVK